MINQDIVLLLNMNYNKMKQIIIVKPKTLDETNKKLLEDAGVIVIEHEYPYEVVLFSIENNGIRN
jgi:hypothetical protein